MSYNKKGPAQIDKVMLHYCRGASNEQCFNIWRMWYIAPIVYSQISGLCFMNRRHHMPENTVIKQVHDELCKSDSLSFDTRVPRVDDLT